MPAAGRAAMRRAPLPLTCDPKPYYNFSAIVAGVLCKKPEKLGLWLPRREALLFRGSRQSAKTTPLLHPKEKYGTSEIDGTRVGGVKKCFLRETKKPKLCFL